MMWKEIVHRSKWIAYKFRNYNFTINTLNACWSSNEPHLSKSKERNEEKWKKRNMRQPNPDIPSRFCQRIPEYLTLCLTSVPSISPSFLALRSRQEALIIDVRLHSRSQIFSSLLKVILHLAAWHGWKLTRVTRGSWSGLLGRCRGCCKRVSVLFRY